MTGISFLRIMFLDAVSPFCLSLRQLCSELFMEEKISISKQGLDEKITKQASDFIGRLLEMELGNKISRVLKVDLFKLFNRVLIKDSTKFDLPKVLAESFPGFGGSASAANVSIQYEFDLKSSTIVDLDVAGGRKNDSSDASEKVCDVQQGDLIIRDLGYYSLSVLKSISDSKAFYLSRLGSTTKVYELSDNEYVELDFVKLYRKMEQSGIPCMEKEVFIGVNKMPVRFIVALVPAQVREERIRKREKENKKKGHKTGADFTARAGLNLFVTNVEKKNLPLEAILQIYHLRWQIELLFKTWKSIFGIHTVHSMKAERFKCVLYSRLLFICICWETVMPFRNRLFSCSGKFLSFDKCFKTMKRYALDFRQTLTGSRDDVEKFILKIYNGFIIGHWLEKKKGKLGFEEIINFKIDKKKCSKKTQKINALV